MSPRFARRVILKLKWYKRFIFGNPLLTVCPKKIGYRKGN
jgi:hypothetical protein